MKLIHFRKIPALLLVIFMFSFAAVASAERLGVNDKAPDFELKDLTGKAHKFSDYLGKVVVLNFWASWCIECTAEMPSLNTLSEKFKNDLVVLGVSVDRSAGPPEAVLKNIPVSYPILLDNKGEVFVKKYTVIGLPTTFVIDRGGIVRERLIGGYDFNEKGLVERIKKLIGGKQ